MMGDVRTAYDDDNDECTNVDAGEYNVSCSASVTTKRASALLISASNKAGMENIDRERINAILLRESSNSDFMKRQLDMDRNANERIEQMKQRLEEKDNAANNDWRKETKQSTIDPLLRKYRSQRRTTSTCVVIDMDSFFISCHILDNPRLSNIPACVGGTSMISTSNYVARKYGVRAAMPGYLGSKLVDEISDGEETLTFVKHDFGLYKKKSAAVKNVLEEYDPNLSMHSLDEAFMDIGPYLDLQLAQKELSHVDIHAILLDKSKQSTSYQSTLEQSTKQEVPISTIHDAAKELLHSIRQRVKDATGLSCSAGLCSNFLLAKIASDLNKPDGQYFVPPTEKEIIEFIHPLPTRKVCGIGRVMEKTLSGLCGIETIKDLFEKRAEVYMLFKPASAQFLLRASIGYADSKRETKNNDDDDADRKGISHERTFSPTSSWSDLCTRLEQIALSLAKDLKERDLRPKTITLKVKKADFNNLSRATTRDVALFGACNMSESAQDLVDIVVNLLREAKREHDNGDGAPKKNKAGTSAVNVRAPFSVRLLGVRCSNFQLGKDNQSSLDRYRVKSSCPMAAKNPYISPKRKDTNETKNKMSSSNPKADAKVSTVQAKTRENDGTQVHCPICNKGYDQSEINAHVDSCLNASTVKQLIQEETQSADERSKKKTRPRKCTYLCMRRSPP